MFPIAALPDTTLALLHMSRRSTLAPQQRFRERCLDRFPPRRVVGIAWRKYPPYASCPSMHGHGHGTAWRQCMLLRTMTCDDVRCFGQRANSVWPSAGSTGFPLFLTPKPYAGSARTGLVRASGQTLVVADEISRLRLKRTGVYRSFPVGTNEARSWRGQRRRAGNRVGAECRAPKSSNQTG